MILTIIKYFKCLLSTEGHRFVFNRNIHGDEIFLTNARSLWQCEKCDKFHAGENLVQ